MSWQSEDGFLLVKQQRKEERGGEGKETNQQLWALQPGHSPRTPKQTVKLPLPHSVKQSAGSVVLPMQL